MGVTKLINADIKGFVYCNPKKPVQTAAKIITDINTIGILFEAQERVLITLKQLLIKRQLVLELLQK